MSGYQAMPGTEPRNGLPGLKPYVYRGTGADTLTSPELQAQLDEPVRPPMSRSGRTG